MATNPNIIIGYCLETAFEPEKYLDIIKVVKNPDFKAEKDFRKMYNGFYKVIYKNEDWYNNYFSLMEEQLTEKRSFKELLKEMYEVGGKVEASFVSKLMATVDVDLPLWDSYIIKHLGYESKWGRSSDLETSERIKVADEIYELIKARYKSFLESDDGKLWVAKFDEFLPEYKDKISNTKKIDFMLWRTSLKHDISID